MSTSEIERFVAELQGDESLQNGVKTLDAGVAPLVAFANEHGYDFTDGDAHAYVKAQTGAELTDEQLDAISGGKTIISSSSIITSTEVVTSSSALVETSVEVSSSSVLVTSTTEVTSTSAVTSTSVI